MHATVLLFDGFSNMVLACLLEPLRAVRDRELGEVDWVVASADDGLARSSSGLRIEPDCRIDQLGRADIVLVVAGYGFREHANLATARRLRAVSRRAGCILAADSAPWLLAGAGMLRRRRATLHWQILDEFAETFPAVRVSSERYVRDGRYWTCGGASTALDSMLALIGDAFGAAAAFDVSTLFVHDAERQARLERGPALRPGHASAPLRRVLREMVDTLEQPQSIERLAHAAHLSTRTLNRLFASELGMPPGRYYRLLRLSRARELAAGRELTQQQIAVRCGFASAASLAKAYSAQFGHPLGRPRGR